MLNICNTISKSNLRKEGKTTRTLVKKNVFIILYPNLVWKILISLTNAIKHLHENGIFHGEIRV